MILENFKIEIIEGFSRVSDTVCGTEILVKSPIVVAEIVPDNCKLLENLENFNNLIFEYTFLPRIKATGVINFEIEGARCKLIKSYSLKKGTCKAKLRLDELPLCNSTVRADKCWRVESMRIGIKKANGKFIIHVIRLESSRKNQRKVLVDYFGQRKKGWWGSKVRSMADLKKSAVVEEKMLHSFLKGHNGCIDCFCGKDIEGIRFKPTGFFRVEQDDRGRWWYVDPGGKPFWSRGITCVRENESTWINIKEIFEDIDKLIEQFPEAAINGNFSFVYANVIRKWGGA